MAPGRRKRESAHGGILAYRGFSCSKKLVLGTVMPWCFARLRVRITNLLGLGLISTVIGWGPATRGGQGKRAALLYCEVLDLEAPESPKGESRTKSSARTLQVGS